MDVEAEQRAYYAALAGEYAQHALAMGGADELVAALEAFRPAGEVLELACGPGTWTPLLLPSATSVTALDASHEMLGLAASRLDGPVRFVQADIFDWRPDRRYDVVFFGFWISHVPPERFEEFWGLVERCLVPGGRVFFMDDAYVPDDEAVFGPTSPVIERRLHDGTPYRVVKVRHEPETLQRRLAALGWAVAVHATAGPFYWGAGARS